MPAADFMDNPPEPRPVKKPLELTPENVARIAQQQKILSLRIGGWSTYQIAEALNMSQPEVSRCLKKALRRSQKMAMQEADLHRQQELERLDAMTRILWDRLLLADAPPEAGNNRRRNPNTKARDIEVLLKISERRAKLLGLDAPEKKEVYLDSQNISQVQLEATYAQLGLPLPPSRDQLPSLPGEMAAPEVLQHLLAGDMDDYPPGVEGEEEPSPVFQIPPAEEPAHVHLPQQSTDRDRWRLPPGESIVSPAADPLEQDPPAAPPGAPGTPPEGL